ncbi:MAG TPA: hypothetical protein VIO33_01565 [Burkholderiaceae bacterium]
MKARTVSSWSALAALALASGAALAADPQDSARSRADVVHETLAARAAGGLAPAGEMPVPADAVSSSTAAASTLTRDAVQSDVRAARAAGELIPAGEGVEYAAARQAASVSLVTRAEVKASVIAARRAGELVPAGEGPDAEPEHVAKAAARTRTAARDEPVNAQQLAKRP